MTIEEMAAAVNAEAERERAQFAKKESKENSSTAEESTDAFLHRLAGLSFVDYDKIRKAAAKKLDVRAKTLDEAVAAIKNKKESSAQGPFETVEPFEAPVHVELLFNELKAIVSQCLVCSREAVSAVVLWIVLSWTIESIHTAPILCITSPEKRCGKTTLLSVLGKLGQRTLAASSVSPAALFRAVELWQPTLLIDEADSFLGDNEELRGIVNSGHQRDTAFVLRTTGDNYMPTKFKTFCLKAIAGIGRQAGTIEDRSIMSRLQRKLPREKVKRLRHIDPEIFNTLRAKLARFAEDYGDTIGRATPALPDVLNDREADNWEPLFAIAELAGSDWLAAATEAALALSGADTTQSRSTELLADIKFVFDNKQAKSIFTDTLISELCSDPEKPWATYNKGRPITARQIARLLKDFVIHSQTIREGETTGKGYTLASFKNAFIRYIPSRGAETSFSSVTTSQANENNDLSHFSCRHKEENVTVKNEPKHANLFSCDLVTDKITASGALASCDGKTPLKEFNLQGEQISEDV
jgi:putative DNA primase/helicase